MTQPLNIAMVISADGAAAAKGLEEAKRGVQGLGTAAKASAGGVNALAAANDQAAAAARRAAQAAIGQSQAEVQARTVVAASTGQLRMQTQNLAFQFQDIATMMAAGQNPFTLLAQQLPQVTMHGGRLTGVMGALKQSLAGFVSPLGLLTTGFVLAGSAAISYFSDANDEADATADALADQADLIQRVADRWGDALPALREYAQALKEATEASELNKASQILLNSYLDDSRKLIADASKEFDRFNQSLASASGFNGFEIDSTGLARAARDATSALDDANEAIEKGEDATRELEAANDALARLLNNSAVRAFDDMADAATRLGAAYAIATEQARAFNLQQATAAAHDANAGRMEKTGQRLGSGADPLSPTEFMSRFGWGEVFDFPKERAAARPRRTEEERNAETYARIVRQAEQAIEMQMLEAEAMGMTGEAADRLRISQELLNQARSAGLELGPEQIAELQALGATMAQVTAETQRQADAMGLRRDVITDVIGGIRQAAEDGKITLQELGDIGMRVLDRLIDKIMNDLIDALTQVGGTGGGGGFLGSLISSIFGGGSAGSTFTPNTSFASFIGMPGHAAGGYTGQGDPSRVAGLVHQEEYVFSAPAVRSIGVGNLERMHRTARSGRGFADGGYTGGSFPAGMGGMRQAQTVDVRVSVDNDGNLQAYVKRESREQAGTLIAQAAPQIVNAATGQTMKSFAKGDADGLMQGRYGTRPVARRLG